MGEWIKNEFGNYETLRWRKEKEAIPADWPGVIALILRRNPKMSLEAIVNEIMTDWFDNEEPITPERIEGYLQGMVGASVTQNADGTFSLLTSTDVR